MRGFVFCSLFLLCGCGAIRDWVADTAQDQAEIWIETTGKEKLEAFVADKVGEEFGEWQAAADADASGDTDLGEWKTWLVGGGGGSVLLMLYRRIAGLEKKQSRKREAQWSAQTDVDKRVTALESAAAK